VPIKSAAGSTADIRLREAMRFFMRQPPRPDWLDVPPTPGAPFFGYNALPWAIQLLLALFIGWLLNRVDVWRLFYDL
jgi:hypothetical protein